MKKLWRKILLLSVMFVLAMSVRSFAATTYSAKTLTFPNQYGAGWSSQFYLSTPTNISVGINMYRKNGNLTSGFTGSDAYYINTKLSYVFQNVNTKKSYPLTGQVTTGLNYELKSAGTIPAGTYSFGVYYTGGYSYSLYFRVTGDSGIYIPDSYELSKGDTRKIPVYREQSRAKIKIVGYEVTNEVPVTKGKQVIEVEGYDNSVNPSILTIKGLYKGTCNITVYGADGSRDTMAVTVTGSKSSPTLLYNDLSMTAGEYVFNEVLNVSSGAAWSSDNTKVAKVNDSGKITAVGYGKTIVSATTTKDGKLYTLDCVVNVKRSLPRFVASLTSFNAAKKRLQVSIKNVSGADMTVMSSGAALYSSPDFVKKRALKMKKYTKYTIKNKKTAKLTFTIQGGTIKGKKYDYAVLLKFKVDGYNYYMRLNVEPEEGEYLRTKNLTSGNWISGFLEA